MKPRAERGTSDNDLCRYMEVCCWDRAMAYPITLHRGVAVTRFVLLSAWFHSDILMSSPRLATSQMQSTRAAAGDDGCKRGYFNKASLRLLLLVQEQKHRLVGCFWCCWLGCGSSLQVMAPSTAEVV